MLIHFDFIRIYRRFDGIRSFSEAFIFLLYAISAEFHSKGLMLLEFILVPLKKQKTGLLKKWNCPHTDVLLKLLPTVKLPSEMFIQVFISKEK